MLNTEDGAAPKTPKRNGSSRSEQRRRRIFRSLHDCIISKGYLKTTLADIAEGADMSASHLLYYFKGKEAILEEYFASVSVRFLERFAEFKDEATEQQIVSLSDFWFRGESGTKLEIGFMLECFGAAVHDDVLKVTKAEFDQRCKEHLTGLFRAARADFIEDPKDAAEIAYSLMIGLRSAVYFDDDIELEGAHSLFVRTLNHMCGIA
jgi:AcrR family transcriptional regulator